MMATDTAVRDLMTKYGDLLDKYYKIAEKYCSLSTDYLEACQTIRKLREDSVKLDEAYEAVLRQRDHLHTQMAPLRKDAERYRLVRANSLSTPFAVFDKNMEILCDEECDTAIDAAMKETK